MAKNRKPVTHITYIFCFTPNIAIVIPAKASETLKVLTYPFFNPLTPNIRLETNIPLAQIVSIIPNVVLSVKSSTIGSARI